MRSKQERLESAEPQLRLYTTLGESQQEGQVSQASVESDEMQRM